MRKCGIYVRVSTDKQALKMDGSLDTQIDTLRKYVDVKRVTTGEPWGVAEIYREEGRTGKDVERPEYQRMLSDIAAGRINVLLCVKIDRVSRSLPDFYQLHALLERQDVTFISLHENWDTSTPMGRFGLKLTLAVAELEREQIAERVREKMAWRAGEGLWNGGRVLGYDLDLQHKGPLIPNDLEAAIIRFIFEKYIETGSMYETARVANAAGYRGKSYESRRGRVHVGKPFTKTDVDRIVRNPVYIGKVRRGQDLFPGKHAPIIPMELWNHAQACLPKARVGHRKHGHQRAFVYRLRGLVRCGHCDGFMTPSAGTGHNGVHRYYKCTRRWDGSGRCDAKLVPARALEEAVVERVKELNRRTDLVRELIATATAGADDAGRALEREREEALREASLLDDRLRKIVDFIGEGRKSETLREELMSLEDKKRALRERTEAIEEKRRLARLRTPDADRFARDLNLFERLWSHASEEKQATMLHLQVAAVIYRPGELELHWYDRQQQAPPDAPGENCDSREVRIVSAGVHRNSTSGMPDRS